MGQDIRPRDGGVVWGRRDLFLGHGVDGVYPVSRSLRMARE